ncbi:hypothetical protein SDC9_206652 [bioreactor metagenome]|uniref:Uncharacterized protein n=1 Tax=bioreactor metagenome TaxID=1076179 RepID=A0A645J654_9ZZZZ
MAVTFSGGLAQKYTDGIEDDGAAVVGIDENGCRKLVDGQPESGDNEVSKFKARDISFHIGYKGVIDKTFIQGFRCKNFIPVAFFRLCGDIISGGTHNQLQGFGAACVVFGKKGSVGITADDIFITHYFDAVIKPVGCGDIGKDDFLFFLICGRD